jgi:hypothetical protein
LAQGRACCARAEELQPIYLRPVQFQKAPPRRPIPE